MNGWKKSQISPITLYILRPNNYPYLSLLHSGSSKRGRNERDVIFAAFAASLSLSASFQRTKLFSFSVPRIKKKKMRSSKSDKFVLSQHDVNGGGEGCIWTRPHFAVTLYVDRGETRRITSSVASPEETHREIVSRERAVPTGSSPLSVPFQARN